MTKETKQALYFRVRASVLFLAVALITLVWIGTRPVTGQQATGQDPNLPDLVGTWDVDVAFYGATLTSPSAYGIAAFRLEITEQTGRVFTGALQLVEDADSVQIVNGAVVGQYLRIGGYDFTVNCTLDPNELMFSGTYNNLPVNDFDDDFATGAAFARRRVQ